MEEEDTSYSNFPFLVVAAKLSVALQRVGGVVFSLP